MSEAIHCRLSMEFISRAWWRCRRIAQWCYVATPCHAAISFQSMDIIEVGHHSIKQWCNDVEVCYIINVSRVILLILGRPAWSRACLIHESIIYLGTQGIRQWSDSIKWTRSTTKIVWGPSHSCSNYTLFSAFEFLGNSVLISKLANRPDYHNLQWVIYEPHEILIGVSILSLKCRYLLVRLNLWPGMTATQTSARESVPLHLEAR